MTKIGQKLIASCLVLAMMTVMVVAVSYAWKTLSTAPEANGIQISLGGRNTIMIAPDQTKISEDGNHLYHYPGKFSQTLNFNQYAQYDYLNAVSALAPVSTADGLHWYVPTYYAANDLAVINGMAAAGQIKPISQFYLDSTLSYANQTDPKAAKNGNFVYLDFWVVSPGADYELRISRGDDGDGSFVIELMDPVQDDNASAGYSLSETSGAVASSVRVGFLVDHNLVLDDTIMYYAESANYAPEYTSLRGSYQESGEQIYYSSAYQFTIYEPNGDLHPDGENGTYTETKPIAWDGGDAVLADISDRLTVQTTNKWLVGDSAAYYLQEVFYAATVGKTYSSVADVKSDFYGKYLQNLLYPYVEQGQFIASTDALYAAMEQGTVSGEALESVERSGATLDTCVASLESNVPQRIRMFVWIEGQDADCTGITTETSFALGIELAGSQIETNGKSKQKDS